MKTYKIFTIITIALLLFSSCKDTVEDGLHWGTDIYYSDFLWEKHESEIMKQTLVFEFNHHAQNAKDLDYVQFEVLERNEQGVFVPLSGIKIYKDNVPVTNNILKVKTSESEVVLGIQFTEKSQKKQHTLILREKGQSGLEITDDLVATGGIFVRQDHVRNPLEKGLTRTVVSLITLLILWYILSRRINPNNKFSKIYFDYNDGLGEQEKRGVGNCYKVVCTNKKQRISPFYKFFMGNIAFEVNDFWTHPVTIKSGTRKNIRISGLGTFELENDETVRQEPFTITNNDGKKVTITTT